MSVHTVCFKVGCMALISVFEKNYGHLGANVLE